MNTRASPSWRRIKVSELRPLLDQSNLTIFDMRDEASFAQSHIEGARYLCNANFEQAVTETPRNLPVLIYCYRGNVSQTGAKIFVEFGFREVYDLIGGYERWELEMAAEKL